MPDTKISDLSDGGAIQDTDEFVVARSSSNVKVAGSQMMRLWENSQINSGDSPFTMDFDTVLEADATSGNIIINLPTISSNKGKTVVVKKMDSSGNTVTLTPNGAETIDTKANYVLSTQYEAVHVVAGTSTWLII